MLLVLQSYHLYYITSPTLAVITIEMFGVTYHDTLMMKEVGLLNIESSSIAIPEPSTGEYRPHFLVGDTFFLLDKNEQHKAHVGAIEKGVLLFTNSGHELLRIARSSSTTEVDYVEKFLAPRFTHGGHKVKYTKKFKISDDSDKIDFKEEDLVEASTEYPTENKYSK